MLQGILVHEYRMVINSPIAHVSYSFNLTQLVFVENLTQLAKFKVIRNQLTKVKRVILMDDSTDPDGWAMTWNKFMGMSGEVKAHL